MSSKSKQKPNEKKKVVSGNKTNKAGGKEKEAEVKEAKTETNVAQQTPVSDKPMTPSKKAKSPPKRRPGQKKEEKADEDMTEEERAEKKRVEREIFIKERCTTFHFIFKKKDDEKKPRMKSYIYEDKMECYADIQRCIARYIKTNNVFIIQTMDKVDILGPKDFVVLPEYRIKEVFAKKMVPEFYPSYSVKWDFYEYHGKPHNWTDFDEIRKRKKEEELAKQKEREEALKLLESMDNDEDD